MVEDVQIESFAPLADAAAKVLILGSVPSIVSLRKQQYYGHQQNAFWPIMMNLFAGPAHADYQQRTQILCARHVAVWDVLKSCRRRGSLDANIQEQSIITNDFIGFFRQHPAVTQVFFNGGLAEKVYQKQVRPLIGEEFAEIRYRRLPSTSPAHATMSLAQKCDAWRIILDHV